MITPQEQQQYAATIRGYIAQKDALTFVEKQDLQEKLQALGFETKSIDKNGKGDGKPGSGTARATLEFIHSEYGLDSFKHIKKGSTIYTMLSDARSEKYLERAQNKLSTSIGNLLSYSNLTNHETKRLQTHLGVVPDGIIGERTHEGIVDQLAVNVTETLSDPNPDKAPDWMRFMDREMLESIHASYPDRVTQIAYKSEGFRERAQLTIDNTQVADIYVEHDHKERKTLLEVSGLKDIDEMIKTFGRDDQAKSDMNTTFSTATTAIATAGEKPSPSNPESTNTLSSGPNGIA